MLVSNDSIRTQHARMEHQQTKSDTPVDISPSGSCSKESQSTTPAVFRQIIGCAPFLPLARDRCCLRVFFNFQIPLQTHRRQWPPSRNPSCPVHQPIRSLRSSWPQKSERMVRVLGGKNYFLTVGEFGLSCRQLSVSWWSPSPTLEQLSLRTPLTTKHRSPRSMNLSDIVSHDTAKKITRSST